MIDRRDRTMNARMFAALASLSLAGAAPPAARPHVDMQRMSDITRTLASDESQGRAPGTPAEDKTIPYLIEQFKAAGLEPAGGDGGGAPTGAHVRTPVGGPAG